MEDPNFRAPSQSTSEFLATVVANAIEVSRRIAPALESGWRNRATELAAGRVTNKATRDWLVLMSDYWGPKDREYAAFLDQLVATYAAGDGPK